MKTEDDSTLKPERDIEVCKTIVKAFVSDWEKTPTLWLQEIDVQAELAHRMQQYFNLEARGQVCGRHSHWGTSKHFFRRVTCEPYVRLGNGYCHPDVVVWDDAPDGDPCAINDGLWPMIMALEIKYKSSTKEHDDADLNRLTALGTQGILTCWCPMWLCLTFPSSAPCCYCGRVSKGVEIVCGHASYQ